MILVELEVEAQEDKIVRLKHVEEDGDFHGRGDMDKIQEGIRLTGGDR